VSPRINAGLLALSLALALTAAVPALAGERTVSGVAPAFDWDLYHARQDACAEKDRIAADCAEEAPLGYCDELALRQATRACSAFGPLGRGETK
jgi:hypothetical protein